MIAQQLEIHYINVGWGGAVLVKGPDGTTVLLEAGNTGDGTNQVVPYLKSIGIQPAQGLDYMIGGHQHCDHIGGLDEVINAGYNVKVKSFYNGSSTTSTCVTGWNAAAQGTTAGLPVIPVVGQQIPLGSGARLTFVAVNGQITGGAVVAIPPDPILDYSMDADAAERDAVAVSNENDRSLVALIQYGGFDWLWGSDLGGGDEACTGHSTSQTDVETSVIQAISPGGATPMISAGGIDALHVNHHGSESSTNSTWMNMSDPAVALISVGAGQTTGFDFPRIVVVENVLLSGTACVTTNPTLVLQSEEGAPAGANTSFAGYSVGDILITTDGQNTFTVSANGQVNQGPNEVASAGLPQTIPLDDQPPVPMTLTIDDAVVSEGDGGTSTVTFTVRLVPEGTARAPITLRRASDAPIWGRAFFGPPPKPGVYELTAALRGLQGYRATK